MQCFCSHIFQSPQLLNVSFHNCLIQFFAILQFFIYRNLQPPIVQYVGSSILQSSPLQFFNAIINYSSLLQFAHSVPLKSNNAFIVNTSISFLTSIFLHSAYFYFYNFKINSLLLCRTHNDLIYTSFILDPLNSYI